MAHREARDDVEGVKGEDWDSHDRSARGIGRPEPGASNVILLIADWVLRQPREGATHPLQGSRDLSNRARHVTAPAVFGGGAEVF